MLTKKSTHHAAPLLDIVYNKVQPWALQNPFPPVVATSKYAEFVRLNKELPPGVSVTRNTWNQRGKTLRGKRKFGDTDTVVTMWKEDGLCTKNEPVLACIVKGNSDFNLGEYTLHCPAGTFILLPPGVPQPTGAFPHVDKERQTKPGVESSCDILWLSFWENVLRCWLCHSWGTSHRSAGAGESAFFADDDIGNIFRALMHEAQQRGSLYAVVCRHFTVVVFTILCRLLTEKRFLSTYYWSGDSREAIAREDIIEYSQEYIRTHLSESLTLARVARIVGLSRTQFAHDFRRQTGQTFNYFVRNCRLQQGLHLLESTTWPINTVSYVVGLSPSQFRELFRVAQGVSPNEYRRSLKSGIGGTHTVPQSGSGEKNF